jgi:hypothetical protein
MIPEFLGELIAHQKVFSTPWQSIRHSASDLIQFFWIVKRQCDLLAVGGLLPLSELVLALVECV